MSDTRVQMRIAENRGDMADQAVMGHTDLVDATAKSIRHKLAQEPLKSQQSRNAEGKIVCRDCNDEISESRLKAIPYAFRCVECQEKATPSPRRNYPGFPAKAMRRR